MGRDRMKVHELTGSDSKKEPGCGPDSAPAARTMIYPARWRTRSGEPDQAGRFNPADDLSQAMADARTLDLKPAGGEDLLETGAGDRRERAEQRRELVDPAGASGTHAKMCLDRRSPRLIARAEHDTQEAVVRRMMAPHLPPPVPKEPKRSSHRCLSGSASGDLHESRSMH